MKRIVCAMVVLGAASIAQAAPLTPAQQAFADAQALAASAQANAVSNLSSGGVSSTVNQFNPTYYNSNGTAPESSLFQGGNGNTVSAGQTKVADCQNGTPNPDPFLRQNCEAINLMVNNPSNRPQITIPQSLFAASRDIEAQGVTDPNAAGTFSSCVNQTVSSLPTAEICSEWFGVSDQQCTMGRVVLVDANTNYQCDKTANTYLPQTCDRAVNVIVTQPAPIAATVTQTPTQWILSETGGEGCHAIYYSGELNCVAWSSGCMVFRCPVGHETTYSCPAGTTLTGSGASSMCVYPAVVTSSVNNGCAVQEADAL